ncbi:outer membrane beta-barrel protein [Moheibacter lacus]|uniref:TonB-dependent receptor n=1 Tax=Moheibacter lacus TaxID=2745851 RepID=A0A838ZQ40_9FLAO|nr:outer membrane beta-barrel protein [Moheibacter lacus]MBA5629125.1 TonB-dependent receptor [Moheibacter lacus]
MFRPFLLILFFAFFSYNFAQEKVNITGTAIDEILQTPVEAATVYLSLKRDSTVVEYSITDAEGNFNLEVKKIEKPVFFTVSDDLSGSYQIDFESLTENKNLGEVQLKTVIDLEGVVISGAPPIRIKTDTLEFNASSFKVRPDANVETLLKQLPGVEIDEEGKITVNGKEVNQILVNGKPFFDKDGKIALQNLPANLINKVQVTDTKTKKEELSGDKASGNNSSINLTIDEDKNKGFMLKAMGGYGTDDRYESSLMANYFKGNTRLSILGSSNNINSVGFSMNDIFDNMSGGRNRSVWMNDSGSFSINGINFGGSGNGITQSNVGGINYSDSWADEDIEFNGSYYYTDSDTKNNNRTVQQNLLPDNLYTTTSVTKSRNQSYNHNFTTELEVKIDSTSTIWFEPGYAYNKTKSSSIFDKNSVNEAGELLNESNGTTEDEKSKQTFSNNINFFKSFRNKSKLNLEFSNSNSRDKADAYNISNTYFYQSGDADDIRNQYTQDRNQSDEFEFNLEYEIPVLDSAYLALGSDYAIRNRTDNTYTFNYDETFQDYVTQNEFLSFEYASDFYNINPYAAFKWRKKKFNLSLNGGVQFLSQKNNGNYLSETYFQRQDYTLPSISANGNYRFGKGNSLYFNYSYSVDLPSAQQLLPIENRNNPLNYYIGNPDLDPTKTHNVYFGYNNFNFQTRTGYNVYFGGNFNEVAITNFRSIDEDFVTTSTYRNVHGNYNLWAGVNGNKSFTKGKSKFRLGGGIGVNHSSNKGFVDGAEYLSKIISLSPRVNFNWDLGEILTVNPSYNLRYQFTDYENYQIENSTNIVHTAKLTTTNYWPKNFVFGNDFSYTYNSNIADGFKKDFFLWNTSLAYNFWKDKLTFKVKVYDILNQNTGDRRTVSDTYISDVQNDVLKRYLMFSLGFKLDKFGGKKERGPGRGPRMMIFD